MCPSCVYCSNLSIFFWLSFLFIYLSCSFSFQATIETVNETTNSYNQIGTGRGPRRSRSFRSFWRVRGFLAVSGFFRRPRSSRTPNEASVLGSSPSNPSHGRGGGGERTQMGPSCSFCLCGHRLVCRAAAPKPNDDCFCPRDHCEAFLHEQTCWEGLPVSLLPFSRERRIVFPPTRERCCRHLFSASGRRNACSIPQCLCVGWRRPPISCPDQWSVHNSLRPQHLDFPPAVRAFPFKSRLRGVSPSCCISGRLRSVKRRRASWDGSDGEDIRWPRSCFSEPSRFSASLKASHQCVNTCAVPFSAFCCAARFLHFPAEAPAKAPHRRQAPILVKVRLPSRCCASTTKSCGARTLRAHASM